jgi:hypothetical protein
MVVGFVVLSSSNAPRRKEAQCRDLDQQTDMKGARGTFLTLLSGSRREELWPMEVVKVHHVTY